MRQMRACGATGRESKMKNPNRPGGWNIYQQPLQAGTSKPKPIGFSTGCLYKTNLSMEERIKLYSSLGATGVEISFLRLNEFEEFNLNGSLLKQLEAFGYVSLHAPKVADDRELRASLPKLHFIYGCLPINSIVLHPEREINFNILADSGLPFLIENMDKRKDFYVKPEQFRELKTKPALNFILDLQHAYENDSSMQLARQFAESWNGRLKQLHVSGQANGNNHALTYLADNKDAVCKMLRKIPDTPIILEGVFNDNLERNIREELEYIHSKLI